MGTYYHAEYTIQETTCPNDKETSADNHCPLLECEFSVSLDKFALNTTTLVWKAERNSSIVFLPLSGLLVRGFACPPVFF